MPAPILPRLSDQMLGLIRCRFLRCRGDAELGRTLTAKAMASFPAHPGWEADCAALLATIRAEMQRVEHVILVPNRDIWSVVDEDCLASVLPPATTLRLYYGPPGRMDASLHYPTYDGGQCLPLLLRLLEVLAPASVYLRGSAQFRSVHLGAAVKASLPHLFMTFEAYDYAFMFDDETLACWGYNPELAEDNRDAEVYLGLMADFVIDKTPGEEWQAAASEFLVPPRVAFFPTLGTRWEASAPPGPREPGPFRLLCAGSMPYFHNYRPGLGFPEWSYQNIIDPIVALAWEPDFRVDIFNASHDPQRDHWPAFGEYRTLWDPARVAYHPRIPLKEVMARIPGYDFGMFYFAASTVAIDYPLQQSLPNRCMSYICGDLPVIVNTEMRYIAALVEQFGAGLAVASTDVAELPGRVRAADLGALRTGAAAMHRQLVAWNLEALQAFRTRLSEGQDRIG